MIGLIMADLVFVLLTRNVYSYSFLSISIVSFESFKTFYTKHSFFPVTVKIINFWKRDPRIIVPKKTQIVNKKQENSQKKNLLTLSLIVLKPSDELKT